MEGGLAGRRAQRIWGGGGGGGDELGRIEGMVSFFFKRIFRFFLFFLCQWWLEGEISEKDQNIGL